MPTENPYLDGTGSFVSTATNAGTVKFASFDDSAVNTGIIAVSATFAGTAVNSGIIGDVFPTQYATFLANNSANWDSAYNTVSDLSAEWMAGGGGSGGAADLTAISDVSASWDAAFTFVSLNSSSLVDTNDSRLSDERTPVAHTHGISDVTGLQTALDDKQASGSYADASHTHGISDVTGLESALDGKQASGDYATLVDGKVPSNQLPSYVDDVIEADSSNDFPVTGEIGKIYVAIDINKTYRWSGSTYVEISPSPGSTDSVTEGSTNLYFTNTRAVNALQSTVNTLSTAIEGKQASGSYATTTTTTALSTAIDSKAATSHTHAISAVTGLQSALDGKQASGSYATTTTTTALSTAIDSKAATSHTHAISAVTGLQTALDAKQASGSYAAASHTHTASQITDFNTAADARITAAAGVSVASLVGGTVPAAQLPSYVDDVLEYVAIANFPATGSTGIIYVATGTNKTYRWSGSAYIEISPSPGSTDSVTEGSTNLYFTDARAVNALQSTVNTLSTAIDQKQASGSYASATDARITLVGTNSANWNNVYSTVQSSSSTWGAGNSSSTTVKTVTAIAYTLSASDANTVIRYNSTGNAVITIPQNVMSVGAQIVFAQLNNGRIIFTPSSGVTRLSPNSATTTTGIYAVASLLQTAQNEWLLTGDVL